MKPLPRLYAEVLPAGAAFSEQTPLGRALVPAGAAKCALLYDGTLNRASRMVDPIHWTDANRSNPVDPAAVAIFADAVRNPAKHGMGRGPIHVVTDLEGGQTLRQSVDAVNLLRAGLGKSAEVSIGDWPGLWPRDDEAWDDAARAATCPVFGFYPFNGVARGGLPYWLGMVDTAEGQMRAWLPRRRRRMAFVTPTFQIWWTDHPEYADLLPMQDVPVPLDWWRAVLLRLIAGGWECVCWGFQDLTRVAAHLDVVCELWGMARGGVNI
jgi:hypothetical protein